jgi:transcriptional regulator with XRE-family HTH domain
MSRKKTHKSELDLNKIGGRIAFIRLENGLSHKEFADSLEISASNLSEVENHKHNPSYIPITRIVNKFNVNPMWLLSGEGDTYIKDNKAAGDQGSGVSIYNKDIDLNIGVSAVVEESSLVNYSKPHRSQIPDTGHIDDFAVAVGQLKEIYDSHDPVLIPAIQANLRAFQSAVHKDQVISQLQDKCADMEKRLIELEKQLASWEGKINKPVADKAAVANG